MARTTRVGDTQGLAPEQRLFPGAGVRAGAMLAVSTVAPAKGFAERRRIHES